MKTFSGILFDGSRIIKAKLRRISGASKEVKSQEHVRHGRHGSTRVFKARKERRACKVRNHVGHERHRALWKDRVYKARGHVRHEDT